MKGWQQRLIWLTSSAALGGGLLALATPSCAAILGMEDPEPLQAPEAGSGGSGGSEPAGGSGGSGGSECEHASWPLPPDGGTTGDDEEFVLALRRVYSSAEGGVTVGWDLDNTCTCQGQGSSCVPPSSSDDLVNDCDELDGRDNNFQKALGPLSIFTGLSDLFAVYSADAENGQWSLLMRVQEYNGEADDRRVRMSWYETDHSLAQPPGWAGTDSWSVSDTSVGTGADGGLDIDAPQYVDENAYITDSVIVATLPEVDLLLGGGTNRLEIRVTAGWITGELYQEANVWKLRNGVLTGRITIQDALRMVSSYRETSGQLLCTDQVGYGVFKALLCAMPDILSSLGPPTQPCDAISMAVGFEADQALLGPIVPTAPYPVGCPPETDPANDSCPSW